MPLRLLIADDNATGRQLLRALLETRQGWQVCGEAENGVDAVTKATELKPDVIVLDLAMPLMDGLHAAREISTTFPTIPVVLYTMHDFAGLDVEAKKVGIRKVVSKTAPANELLFAIDEVLKAAAPLAASAAAAQAATGLGNGAMDATNLSDADANSKPN